MQTLERQLGLAGVVAIGVGSMLGTGVFVMPGVAITSTGSSLWIAYFLAAIFIIPAALCKAELGTAMPAAGGAYIYMARTFGPIAGSIVGFGLWVSSLLKAAFALVGISAYLSVFTDYGHLGIATVFLAAIVVLNIVGVGKVSKSLVYVIAACVSTLVILLFLAPYGDSNLEFVNLRGGVKGLMTSTGLAFVSFAGIIKIVAIAEEIKDPSRNIPRGIIISILAVAILYCLVAYALTESMPFNEISHNLKPLHSLAFKAGGKIFGYVVALIAILTMTSMANAGLLAASRFPFAMSRDKLLPSPLGRLHAKFTTPYLSILASGALVFVIIFTLDAEKIAKLGSAFFLALFSMVCFTVIVLREARVQWYNPGYRAPLYPFLQIVGMVASLYLLARMGTLGFTAILGVGAAGSLIYVFYGRTRTRARGIVGFRVPRNDLKDSTKLIHATLPRAELSADTEALAVLFQDERSPELLVEFGTALTAKGQLAVIHLEEVPEQTELSEMPDDSSRLKSLRRRIQAISDNKGVPIAFRPIVTHDIFQTIFDLSARTGCYWLIKEWAGKSEGRFTLYNKMDWIERHTKCNVATLKDAGIRYIRKIAVLARGDRNDAFVVATAKHLATVYSAELTVLICTAEKTPDANDQKATDYLEKLCRKFEIEPRFGQILTSEDYIEAVVQASPEYDLLVLSTSPRRRSFVKTLAGTSQDKIISRAACSVVAIRVN